MSQIRTIPSSYADEIRLPVGSQTRGHRHEWTNDWAGRGECLQHSATNTWRSVPSEDHFGTWREMNFALSTDVSKPVTTPRVRVSSTAAG